MIVLSAIPFGVVGAILGHLLFNQPMSVLSLLGVIALSGVVVNDSLLLVVFVNILKHMWENKKSDYGFWKNIIMGAVEWGF